VLALLWEHTEGVLIDANRRRCAALEDALVRLRLGGRVSVRCERAEVLAWDPDLRGQFDLVVARAFGKPAVTAECAVGFLQSGGCLIVSEPPEAQSTDSVRWPDEGLAVLGLGPAVAMRTEDVGAVAMSAAGPPGERWPRAVGRPAKSPLW
jgi:16S rRNA (guanine527-N7)-methyltransferase